MRATRRCLERSTAFMFANIEYVELVVPESVDSVRDVVSDASAWLGRGYTECNHEASLGGRGGGAPRPMEGSGEGGGRKPPMKGSAMGPTSSTGWNLPSGPL